VRTFISLLRGINVGGKTIRMADLKSLYESLGFSDVTTYIQSGNVLFATAKRDPAALCASIAAAIKKKTGLDVTVIIRQPLEIAAIIKRNPFIGRRGVDETKLHVTFLKEQPAASLVKALQPLATKSKDEYAIIGKEIYLHCPTGYGKTLLNNAFFEKNLQTPATTRNWNTVNVLMELAANPEK